MKTNQISCLKWACYLLIGCLPFGSHAQSKITFKKFDDPSMSHYGTIVFEYEEDAPNGRGGKQTVTKEFDIQKNNPFNSLSQKTTRENSDGSKVKEFPVAGRKAAFEKLGIEYDPNLGSSKVPLIGSSHIMMTNLREKYLAIAYNFFVYDKSGYLCGNGRVSAITILNQKGEIVSNLEDIDSDVYSPKVSNNGRYLTYAYGEPIEHAESFPSKSGFKIIDLSNSKELFDIPAIIISGVFVSRDEVNIRADEKGGEFYYSFDQNSSSLYRIEGERVGPHIGFQIFQSRNSTDTLTVKDFIQIEQVRR